MVEKAAEEVRAVCATLDGEERAEHTLENATSLLDKSLLRTMQQESKQSRLVMLERIRAYGLECLMASEESKTTHRAHTLYYLRIAEEAATKLSGPLTFMQGEYMAASSLLEEGLALARTGRWRQGILWGRLWIGMVSVLATGQ